MVLSCVGPHRPSIYHYRVGHERCHLGRGARYSLTDTYRISPDYGSYPWPQNRVQSAPENEGMGDGFMDGPAKEDRAHPVYTSDDRYFFLVGDFGILRSSASPVRVVAVVQSLP
jgi:hypothetical protein